MKHGTKRKKQPSPRPSVALRRSKAGASARPAGGVVGRAAKAARSAGRSAKKALRRATSAASRLVPNAAGKAPAGKTRPGKASSGKVGSGKVGSGKVPRARTATRRKLRGDPAAILERLSLAIVRPHVELAFGDPWQLLIAVILSAQSTDRRVNQVTPEVFRRWPSPAALSRAVPSEVEEVIKSTGFFRNKTKAIIGASALIAERFGRQVPRSMPEILEVPGVARKTGNVVLGSAYQIPSGIVVDTHVARVAQRLELSLETTPEKIELDLCRAFPEDQWIRISHRLVLHGRYVCTARAPACPACPLNELCPARLAPGLGAWPLRAEREAIEMEARARGFTRV